MGSRERRRAERRKRRQRVAERSRAENGDPYADAAPEEGFAQRAAKRSEERNAEARAQLEPLPEGERPTAVTVGFFITILFALIFTVSAVVAALTDTEIRGEQPNPVPLAIFGGALWMMAYGLWKARYWAVLGLQMLLVLVLVSAALGLVQVTTVLELAATLTLLSGAGALFYFLIRAMARIQMPERPGSK